MTTQRQVRNATLIKLRTLSEHSLGGAAHSMAAFLGHPVRLVVSGVTTVDTVALPKLLTASDTSVMVGLRFLIAGDLAGQIVILFPRRTIFRMLQLLIGANEGLRGLSPQEQSAVQEVGNILVSAFLSGLGDLLGKRLHPSPPEIHLNDLKAMARHVTEALAGQSSEAVVVQALFEDPAEGIEGQFFMLPEVAPLESILHPADGGRGGEA